MFTLRHFYVLFELLFNSFMTFITQHVNWLINYVHANAAQLITLCNISNRISDYICFINIS